MHINTINYLKQRVRSIELQIKVISSELSDIKSSVESESAHLERQFEHYLILKHDLIKLIEEIEQ